MSNLDLADMAELVEAGRASRLTDQVLYKLTRRGPERELLPWLADHARSAMAYSPVEQGRLTGHPGLARIAQDMGCTPTQLALAWVLRITGAIATPKAGDVAHVRENRAAADLVVSGEVMQRPHDEFPAPRSRVPLQML